MGCLLRAPILGNALLPVRQSPRQKNIRPRKFSEAEWVVRFLLQGVCDLLLET